MTTHSVSYDTVMPLAEAALAEKRSKIQGLAKAYFKATASVLGIVVAVGIEMFTMTVSLHASLPGLSDSTDAGSDLMPIRYGIAAALLFGHVLLHDHSERPASLFGIILKKGGVIPIVATLGGMSLFMASSVATATGNGDGHLDIMAVGLAAVFASLFSISFLASNKLVGFFLPALNTILTERGKQAEAARIEKQVQTTIECRAALDALRGDIADDEEPDTLRRRAATEAAAAVGSVAAEAHDAYVSRAALEGLEFGPEDTVTVSPDTSLEALKARADYLKSLDFTYFFNLLNKDAHHA